MSDMARNTVSVRELQQNLKRVMARVEPGQVIEVTRRRRPVVRLAPVRETVVPLPWPDLDARARTVFGNRVISPSTTELVTLFHPGRGVIQTPHRKHLSRSLDLLHIAAAHALACTTFVSGDDRQLAVAKASGLKTIDIKRRAGRRRP